jgi:uncharacterized protein YbjQ (UPF0145 family)
MQELPGAGPATAQSLARIEAGQITLEAERRLQSLSSGGLFTSDLTVAEFALTQELGLQPLGQVMGGSIHQVGYQYLTAGWYGEQVFVELDVITQAWDQARRRALNRLRDEARQLDADAVIGVRIHRGEHDWAAGCVDYVVTGTAVRWSGERASDPLLTDLSVQDYWKLVGAGWEPVGIAASTSVFFVAPSSASQWSRMLTAGVNQELTEYTQGFYAARESAISYLSHQAAVVGASGVVGVQIDHSARLVHLVAGSNDRGGLQITFQAMGTAIRETQSVAIAPPETTVRMGAAR